MNYFSQLIAVTTMFFGISTSLGVFLHDTNVDKAFVLAWSLSTTDGSAQVDDHHKPGSTPHTHSDHGGLSSIIKDGQAHPRTTPRNGDRKHLHHKTVSRAGDSDFDGHRLVIKPQTA